MNKRSYVVSGTHNEFMAYKLNKNDQQTQYVYVSKPEMLRGLRDPKGVFYGSWRNRTDILDVVQQLRVSTTNDNPTLDRVWAEVWKKANHQQINQVAVNSAAQRMADDIDRQVLESMNLRYTAYDYKNPNIGDMRHNSYIDKAEIFDGRGWKQL